MAMFFLLARILKYIKSEVYFLHINFLVFRSPGPYHLSYTWLLTKCLIELLD